MKTTARAFNIFFYETIAAVVIIIWIFFYAQSDRVAILVTGPFYTVILSEILILAVVGLLGYLFNIHRNFIPFINLLYLVPFSSFIVVILYEYF